MKNALAAAAILAATSPLASARTSWEAAVPAARAALAARGAPLPGEIQAAPIDRDPAEIPGDGAGLPCVEYGRRTERIPGFDPIHGACVADALSGPGEFDAAWRALLARIRGGGGPLMPVPGGDPFSGRRDEVQQALGKGTLRKEALDEARHWGDAVYLQMRPAADALQPVAVFAVTYRAYRVTDREGSYLMATRVDFTSDGQGRLNSVQFWSGIKLSGAPAMAWTQGPSRMVSDSQSLEGLWGRRWRQLVRSWVE